MKRKDNGLDLSTRVWNSFESYKFELEAGLTAGIAKGESAASMARTLQRYLKYPDKLFRRVTDKTESFNYQRPPEFSSRPWCL